MDIVSSIVVERMVSVNGADLYLREVGQGHPIVLLDGGPNSDHAYPLPDMNG